MAGRGAHLTQTVQIKPSLFDYVAQESLNDLLHPAVKKVIDVLALRNGKFIIISKWFDEYFLFGHFLLQWYYLKKYGASFSEKFFGLQRIPVQGSKSTVLSNKELVFSLLTISLFPYLKSKLDNFSDKLLFDSIPRTNQRKKILLMKSVIQVNSVINIIYQIAKFVQHLRYISGFSEINSPMLWASRVKLAYADHENLQNDSFSLRNFIPKLLQRSLEISAFFIQFFQWWQTEKSSSLGALPTPPPPVKTEHGTKYSGKCPICLEKRKIDTALTTSGFVFCFKCITTYLIEHNKCPVTKLPSTVNNLIRIYPPS